MIYLVQKKDAEKVMEVKRFGYYTNLLEYMGSLGFCIGDFNDDFYMELHDKKAATTTVAIKLPGKDADEYQIVTVNEDFKDVPFMLPQMAGVNPLTAMNSLVPQMNYDLGYIFKNKDLNTVAAESFDNIMKNCKTDTDEDCKVFIGCVENTIGKDQTALEAIFPNNPKMRVKLGDILHSYHNGFITPKHTVSAIKHVVKGEKLDDNVIKVKIIFSDDLAFFIISKDDECVKAYISKTAKTLEDAFGLVKQDKYPDVYNKFISNIKGIFLAYPMKDKMLEKTIMNIIEKEEVKDSKDAYANIIMLKNCIKNKDDKVKLINHVFSSSTKHPMPLLINNTFIDIIDWIDGTSKRLSSDLMNIVEFDSRFKIFMDDVEILTDGRDEKRLKKIRKIIEHCKEDRNTNSYRNALFKIQNLVADKHADNGPKDNTIVLDSLYVDTCNIGIDNSYESIMLYIRNNCHKVLEEKDDMDDELFRKVYKRLINNIATLVKDKNDPVFQDISNAEQVVMSRNSSSISDGYRTVLRTIEEIADHYMNQDKCIDEVSRKRNECDGFITMSEVFVSDGINPISVTIDNSYNAATNYIDATARTLTKCITDANYKYFINCYKRFIDNIEIICERRKEDVFKALSDIVTVSKHNQDGTHFTKEDKENIVNNLYKIISQIQSYNNKK